MIIAAFGLFELSPLELSGLLRKWHVSHTVIGTVLGRTRRMEVDGLSKEQPAWPIVLGSVYLTQHVICKHDHQIYFVVDSPAALSNTNLNQALWPQNRGPRTIEQAVYDALTASTVHFRKTKEQVTISYDEPTIDTYVSAATNPSCLNLIQTAIYKINPYQLRKEVQALCISYLAGGISKTKLKQRLKSNHKLEPLRLLMDSADTEKLRAAVQECKTGNVETVAQAYNLEPYEIRYVMSSFAKNRTI